MRFVTEAYTRHRTARTGIAVAWTPPLRANAGRRAHPTLSRIEHGDLRIEPGELIAEVFFHLGRGAVSHCPTDNLLGLGLGEVRDELLGGGNESGAHAEAAQSHAEQDQKRSGLA